MKILLIGVGGFLGAISRYYVSKGSMLLLGNRIPYGTLVVNVAGSFLLGLIFTLSVEKLAVSENLRFLIAVGFLGAFTTFSTFSVESLYLFEDGAYASAFIYIFGNVILSLTAAFVGIYIARL
ncbi:CrcB protein [Denitrovibrio acetiphilus DSM 12809]|uniref:Fluoride-specific ion channel FluC n=1 Tax=Denitrovibrio acetiphilus (strain DSM 12809 / NBRC 114555 / N2460) TaxID=522772 RepID=D4H0T5_DENA2|nr:fluoride efflux transporter CrcB [Denitrovibrio acetiphilus]ADD68598.1 CrcB protein [Denitrovibrio acetiphilus DSM 12809]